MLLYYIIDMKGGPVNRKTVRMRKLLQKRTGLIKQFRSIGPLVDGSLVVIQRATRPGGKKYPGYFLTYKPPRTHPGKPSKTKTLYVPVALVEEVKRWSEECAKARFLIREISDTQREIIRTHVEAKGRGGKE